MPLRKGELPAQSDSSEGPEFMTRAQAATYLQVSERTLDNWIRKKGLPAIKLSRKAVRLRKTEVDAWLRGV